MTNIKYARLLACLLASADRQLEIVAVQKGETWKYARYNSMQDINRLFEIVSAGREKENINSKQDIPACCLARQIVSGKSWAEKHVIGWTL